MYNTECKVTYHEIETELVFKLKVKDTDTTTTDDDSPDLEYEYSTQEIIDICHKLYIDEICSVMFCILH